MPQGRTMTDRTSVVNQRVTPGARAGEP